MLKLGPSLSIPDDAITRTFGILAMRGAGKSNLAAVMAEEMFRQELPFVAIDPVGSWWGLRSSKDGKGKGLAIPIFGGDHGDVPIERTSGELVADLVVDKRLSCIIDLSTFDSESAKKAFLLAFAQRLYRKNTDPLHLFLEEADDYIPQRVMREEAHLLRAWENIVRRGRARGLGMTMITQRSASINKNVLTQVETLFALRATAPQDQDAIEAWVKYNGQSAELIESLPGLQDGEAWCWSPQWLGAMKRARIRLRNTFDSGATPKSGGKQRKVATLADIDLPALGEKWAATIERAKADDPRELRNEVARLKKELTQVKVAPAPEPAKPAISQRQFENAIERIGKLEAASVKALDSLTKAVSSRLEELRGLRAAVEKGLAQTKEPQFQSATYPTLPRTHPPVTPVVPRRASASHDDEGKIGNSELHILAAIVQHGPLSKPRLALITGFTMSGTFSTYLSRIKGRGWIVYESDGNVRATDFGCRKVGDVRPIPADPHSLYALWARQIGSSLTRILSALRESGGSASVEELAKASGFAVSGTFSTYLSRLRKRGLIGKATNPITMARDLY